MRKRAVLILVSLFVIAGCAVNPQSTEPKRVDTPYRLRAMYVDLYAEGNYVYALLKEPMPAGKSRSALEIVDISYPEAPRKMGAVQMPGKVRSVYISGDYAYTACSRSGLQIVDVSDKASPTIVGNLNMPGNAVDVHVSGDYAYTANQIRTNDMHLNIIDISDRRSPVVVGNAYTPGTAHGVYVSGDYAYVADNHSGLQIIDVGDKANPVNLGETDASQGTAKDVCVSGDYAYIAQAHGLGGGLEVVDISDKAKPVLVAVLDTLDTTSIVHISGDYVYMADRYHYAYLGNRCHGLQVIDVSNNAKPMFLGKLGGQLLPVAAMAIDDSKALAYLAGMVMDETGGVQRLQVVDISDKTYPVAVGSIKVSAAVR